jgi:general transcription factor 3C polypeptide 3 (transcription factor C subunit 4)
MFAALTRICHSPVSWYCSGPVQKYVLRQIKAMDFGLLADDQKGNMAEKASYSAQDDSGHLIINKDMDLSLLKLYGHILSTGSSYAYALSESS